jgi:hypothetical protein
MPMEPPEYYQTMSTYKSSDYTRASQLRTGLQDAIAESASGFFEPIMESVEVANNYRRCIYALLDATPEVIEMRAEIAALKKMVESKGGIEMNINDPIPDGSSKIDDIYREFGEDSETHKKTVHAHIPGDTITSRLVDFQTYLKNIDLSVSHTDILAYFEEIFQDVVDHDVDEETSIDEGSQFSEPVFRKPPGQKPNTKSKKLKLIEDTADTSITRIPVTASCRADRVVDVSNQTNEEQNIGEEAVGELHLQEHDYEEEVSLDKLIGNLQEGLSENEGSDSEEEEETHKKQQEEEVEEEEEEEEVEEEEEEEEEVEVEEEEEEEEEVEVDEEEEEEEEVEVEEEEEEEEEEEVEVEEEEEEEEEVEVEEEEEEEEEVEVEEEEEEEEEVEVEEEEEEEEEEEVEVEEDETDEEGNVPTKERTPPVEETTSDQEDEFFLVELEDEEGEPMSFYTQDEENGDIYEVLDDEEIGDKIGVFKDGEPELF